MHVFLFQTFLLSMQEKAKCANSNYFKNRKRFYNSFSKKREGKNTQQFSFRKEKNFVTLFKCTNLKQNKNRTSNQHSKVLWLTMAESDTFQT